MPLKTQKSTYGDLVEYYGTECHFCIKMNPFVQQLEKELGVKLEKKECWHNAANQAQFMKDAEGKCSGVPFYLNRKTGKFICGATSYEKLKAWALGK